MFPIIGIWLRIGIAAFAPAHVVQKPRNRERLAVAQLDVGLGIALGERRNPETGERHAVVEVERADFRPHMQADVSPAIVGVKFRRTPNSLYEHGHVADVARHDRHGKLPARQEAGLLTVVRDEVRLGQALEAAVLLDRLQDPADARRSLEEEEVQQIAERRCALQTRPAARQSSVRQTGPSSNGW